MHQNMLVSSLQKQFHANSETCQGRPSFDLKKLALIHGLFLRAQYNGMSVIMYGLLDLREAANLRQQTLNVQFHLVGILEQTAMCDHNKRLRRCGQKGKLLEKSTRPKMAQRTFSCGRLDSTTGTQCTFYSKGRPNLIRHIDRKYRRS
jgi:hypothetical protein